MENVNSTPSDHTENTTQIKTGQINTGHINAPDMNAISVLSDGMVALLWRGLDGFDGWLARRAAIRRLYNANGTQMSSTAVGNAALRGQVDARH